MADGFLGRWSRRKMDVQQGRPVEAEPPAPLAVPPVAPPAPAPAALVQPAAEPAAPPEPPPTLQDVQALTPESDFARFTRADVDPEVKNAAMKKLFADPRYNVMDGMDIYIDDYSKPDPLPEKMLKDLASARFLGLFDEEKDTDEAKTAAQSPADTQPAQTVAQSGAPAAAEPAPAEPEPPAPAVPESPAQAAHADPDLRLQQDHAPGRPGPGPGAG